MQEEYLYDILRSPVMTEKSTVLSESGKYVFKTKVNATKSQIKRAVEKIFKVKVVKVHTMIIKGKVKYFRRIRGVQSDYKKAIVTLAENNNIDLTVGIK